MEFDLIERVRDLTAQARDDVLTGIGDDAAILAVPAGRELAVAMDTLVAGVHFPAGTRAFDIGWKALAVNLSDLAAMGAVPAWALLSMTSILALSTLVGSVSMLPGGLGVADASIAFLLTLVIASPPMTGDI